MMLAENPSPEAVWIESCSVNVGQSMTDSVSTPGSGPRLSSKVGPISMKYLLRSSAFSVGSSILFILILVFLRLILLYTLSIALQTLPLSPFAFSSVNQK